MLLSLRGTCTRRTNKKTNPALSICLEFLHLFSLLSVRALTPLVRARLRFASVLQALAITEGVLAIFSAAKRPLPPRVPRSTTSTRKETLKPPPRVTLNSPCYLRPERPEELQPTSRPTRLKNHEEEPRHRKIRHGAAPASANAARRTRLERASEPRSPRRAG